MIVNASHLRSNIYKLLDSVLESGKPLIIKRKGKLLKIVPDAPGKKLARLTKHHCMIDEPESYVHCDWSEEWSHDLP